MNVTPGTLIHGTLRNVDLIPAFADELERIVNEKNREQGYPEKGLPLILTANGAIIESARICDDDHALASNLVVRNAYSNAADAHEAVAWLVNELIDGLDAEGPEGFTFGNNEGDGSDFGWWATTPEFHSELRIELETDTDPRKWDWPTLLDLGPHESVSVYEHKS